MACSWQNYSGSWCQYLDCGYAPHELIVIVESDYYLHYNARLGDFKLHTKQKKIEYSQLDVGKKTTYGYHRDIMNDVYKYAKEIFPKFMEELVVALSGFPDTQKLVEMYGRMMKYD